MTVVSTPIRSFVLACLAACCFVPSAALAGPQITSLSPTTLGDGDVLTIDGFGFLPDPSRYSVVLRDDAGLVALGEVVSADVDTLSVIVHRLRRGSEAAEVVVHEGIRIPLVGLGSTTVTTDAATWFHGSGVLAEAGSVIVLPPTTPTQAPIERRVPTKPDNVPVPDCPGGVFDIDIPLGCKEITVGIRIGGDDPFNDIPLRTGDGRSPAKSPGGSIHDLWAGTWIGRLHGQAITTSTRAAKALADSLSSNFGTLGVHATVEQNDHGTVSLRFEGKRMTATTGAVLVTLVCEAP